MPGLAWERNEEITTKFHYSPNFSTFYGNEWSGMSDVGGDHNVIYGDPGLPIYRSNSYYEPKNPFLYSGSDLDAPHIIQLYKRLERLAEERGTRSLAFPSIRGRRANPQWNDVRFSPILEVISEAGWFEDLALDFLRRGHRAAQDSIGVSQCGRVIHMKVAGQNRLHSVQIVTCRLEVLQVSQEVMLKARVHEDTGVSAADQVDGFNTVRTVHTG